MNGAVGYSLPSLTGYHPQSRDGRYEVISQIGCEDELAACGFQVENDAGRIILVDPSYIAAAAFGLDCLNRLEPEDPI